MDESCTVQLNKTYCFVRMTTVQRQNWNQYALPQRLKQLKDISQEMMKVMLYINYLGKLHEIKCRNSGYNSIDK